MNALASAAAELGISELHVAEALLLIVTAASHEALRNSDVMKLDSALARLDYVLGQMNALGATDMDRAKANGDKLLEAFPISLTWFLNGLTPCGCANCSKCREAVQAAMAAHQATAKAAIDALPAALGAIFGVFERGPRDAGG